MPSAWSIVTALAMSSVAVTAAALTPQQEAWLAKGTRHDRGGWIYLHIAGEPRERGFQHGYLTANEIADGLRVTRAMWLQDSSMEWSWLVAESNRFIAPAVDAEDREEIAGIVEGMRAAGADTTLGEMIAFNAYIELDWYWWPEKKKLMTDEPMATDHKRESCSSFIATGSMTTDGGIVLGHNTMGDYVAPFANLILDIVPTHGHRILMQSQPGLIDSSTDFFENDAGLVGSETTIGNFHSFSEKGIPEFVRMRRATQDAATIDQWCAIMRKGNNGGYANAWLIGDVNTREIARLELGLKYVGFERKKDGYFIGSNIAENLHILRLETDTADTDIRLSSVARRVRWKQLMKQYAGKIDLERAKSMEADCYDTCLNKENPSGRTLAGHAELDPQLLSDKIPYSPFGTFDSKVVDTRMAKRMEFAARWGSADGTAFDAAAFLTTHPQFDWMEGYLKDRPAEPWVVFRSGESP